MKRLSCLLVNNNYISRIGRLGDAIHSVTALILTNNRISSLSDIDNIATLSKLEHLSLVDNPVAQRMNYRLYTIFRIPSLKSLDFVKVSTQERACAKGFFTTTQGHEMIAVVSHEGRSLSFGQQVSDATKVPLSEEQKRKVRWAIESAKTKEEIDLIEKQLKVIMLAAANESVLSVTCRWAYSISMMRWVMTRSKKPRKRYPLMGHPGHR